MAKFLLTRHKIAIEQNGPNGRRLETSNPLRTMISAKRSAASAAASSCNSICSTWRRRGFRDPLCSMFLRPQSCIVAPSRHAALDAGSLGSHSANPNRHYSTTSAISTITCDKTQNATFRFPRVDSVSLSLTPRTGAIRCAAITTITSSVEDESTSSLEDESNSGEHRPGSQSPPSQSGEQQHQQHQQHRHRHHQHQQYQQHVETSDTSSSLPSGDRTHPSSSQESDAERLFDDTASHIPQWTPLLALYAPLGILIAAFRICLWLLGALIDAPWFRSSAVVSTYLRLLGFRTTWSNVDRLPEGRHVMVSNHVTPGDLMVLFQGLPQRYVHLITTAMPARVTTTRNLPCDLRFATPEAIEKLAAGGSFRSLKPTQTAGSSTSSGEEEREAIGQHSAGRNTFSSSSSGEEELTGRHSASSPASMPRHVATPLQSVPLTHADGDAWSGSFALMSAHASSSQGGKVPGAAASAVSHDAAWAHGHVSMSHLERDIQSAHSALDAHAALKSASTNLSNDAHSGPEETTERRVEKESVTEGNSRSSTSGRGLGAERESGVTGLGAAAGEESESRRARSLEAPIHLFPEGGVTNGRWGMMQFSRGFTRLLLPGDLVVPVALRVETPWDIRTHTLSSSFPANLFWLSFCPWVHIHATVLEPIQRQSKEQRGAFVQRVQRAIADEAGLVVSECTISAKRRLMQKRAAARQ